MPEAAFAILRVAVELVADYVCCRLVFLFARAFVPPEEVVADAVVVERVVGGIPICDLPIGKDYGAVDL